MAETAQNNLPPVTDVRSAAAHIEGLLSLSNAASRDDDIVDTEDNESAVDGSTDDVELDAADNDAHDEDHASADEETDEVGDEPEEKPAIVEPPKSWSAEDAAKFKELPLDLQHVVAKRESERDKAINQRMQQIAEERKVIETHVAKANEVQTQYVKTLNQLITLTMPDIQKVDNVDWVQLAQDDPAEYVRLSALRDGLRQRVNYMEAEKQKIEQQDAALRHQHFQNHLSAQTVVLREMVPEFNEPAKANALVRDICSTMSTYGFSDAELGQVADARIVRVMARLAQFEKLEAAKKSAQGKKTGAPAPRLMTPNAAPAREDNRTKKIDDQFKQLRRSGSVRDAARLFEQIL